MSQPLKVTVVTAVLNGEATLHQAIASVAQQDYPALEHVVVDGGSTDGTLEIIAANLLSIDVVVGGPDSGIAEAMNKGIAAASGDLVLFLHSDDRFVDPYALSRAMQQVKDLNHIWAFDVLYGQGAETRRLSPRPFNAWARLRNPLPHQGVLFPRHLFDQLGAFDRRWRVSMDYELWLRALAARIPLVRTHSVLSLMGRGGVSSRQDWSSLRARLDEERAMQAHHAPNIGWRVVYAVFWPAYLAYRRSKALLRCWA